ncbi:MAG: HAD family hydrolase [Chthonomonadales bacterium]
MSNLPTLFLDFDDTLVDSAEHAKQYVGELSAVLASAHGIGSSIWEPIVGRELVAFKKAYTETFNADNLTGFTEWMDQERVKATKKIFFAVDVALPTDDDILEFARRIQFDALCGCNASFDGVYDALLALFDAEVRMNIASANESAYLLAALVGAGIESFTESKFGPDLIDCVKESVKYYEVMFDFLKIDPKDVVVLDDQVECLEWASSLGAKVIQSDLLGRGGDSRFPQLTNFSQLPVLVLG